MAATADQWASPTHVRAKEAVAAGAGRAGGLRRPASGGGGRGRGGQGGAGGWAGGVGGGFDADQGFAGGAGHAVEQVGEAVFELGAGDDLFDEAPGGGGGRVDRGAGR